MKIFLSKEPTQRVIELAQIDSEINLDMDGPAHCLAALLVACLGGALPFLEPTRLLWQMDEPVELSTIPPLERAAVD